MPTKGLTVRGATVLGIGSMIGAGIFALLGEAGAVALMVFLLVGAAGWRRRRETGSKPAVIIAALTVTAIVLGFFAVDTLQKEPATFVAIVALALLSVALDAIVRHGHHPTPSPRPPARRPVASSSA